MRPSSPASDDPSGRDFKCVLIEKDNVDVRKEAERMVMTKDTGKQFMSAGLASGNDTSYQVLLICITNTNTLTPQPRLLSLSLTLLRPKDVFSV